MRPIVRYIAVCALLSISPSMSLYSDTLYITHYTLYTLYIIHYMYPLCPIVYLPYNAMWSLITIGCRLLQDCFSALTCLGRFIHFTSYIEHYTLYTIHIIACSFKTAFRHWHAWDTSSNTWWGNLWETVFGSIFSWGYFHRGFLLISCCQPGCGSIEQE